MEKEVIHSVPTSPTDTTYLEVIVLLILTRSVNICDCREGTVSS